MPPSTPGLSELVAAYDAVKDDQVKEIIEDYKAKYDVDPALLDAKYDSLTIPVLVHVLID